jgi:hypothetical protein
MSRSRRELCGSWWLPAYYSGMLDGTLYRDNSPTLKPSMGLSPLLVKEVFGIISKINRDLGVTILLVEQNARAALSVTLADRVPRRRRETI